MSRFLLFIFPCLCMTMTAVAEKPAVLKPLWEKRLDLHSPVNAVVGRVDGKSRLCVQGTRYNDDRADAGVQILDEHGQQILLHVDDSFQQPSTVGAYLQWIDLGLSQDPAVLFSLTPQDKTRRGIAQLVNVSNGDSYGTIQNTTHFGNISL
ncbi:hypothetical protein Pla110_09290 [Polystyrenella longa]|uniref:Uncharacterized protein n=1 Tax=Polystyrenella longa TaxID=2528007 RepID=A0A518CJ15_9PLAN|nr:hypothetical protein [Polystyrenella longa]QDU79223.1 hypothetical protein Pla110_09290 [Polystyrenella longa]